MTLLSRKDWALLVLLTVSWGFNWPIMKLGVTDYPPLAFRALSMIGGLPAIWLAARMQGVSLAVPRDKIGEVAKLALPNMVLWHFFVILGVRLLSSGRAAILGYTMPVWAALFGLLFFGQRLSRSAWFGIACAFGGALLLMSTEFANVAGKPAGSLMVLIAAAAWGYGTVLMKRSDVGIPTISLTFWMLLLATLTLAIGSVLFERQAWHLPNATVWWAMAYNALIIFGFAHTVWFGLARKLPPVASSLSVMMIPVLGVFSGAWLLGETPHWQDYAAMALIMLAMSSVLLKPAAPAAGQ
ncbi:Permease of the drug/metabolite transporter (DMT) superfamily [Noviherbaspirillum humi]|uniref:Permease of the drug/metabolite transporter (DMT) superfamily n=1 Tax=Noviherbaspirillum humi TaxID=1688639 RepID=A0A239J3A1_9BURK|nr:EamA family transporter [Noviherbaspirillum humi]SNT00280.1 Permease of the drug/metabolite transporter (DMT) superfamily [Noviherbaspirillum humi]